MCYDNYLKFKSATLLVVALTFLSCGSYQYVGTDNDGIYDSTYENVEYVEVAQTNSQPNNTNQESNNSNDYYQNYFKEKKLEYDAIKEENEIFTDVDSYSSEEYVAQDSTDNSYRGYAGWGQANDNVTINIYDNGWNNWGWGWNNWGWNVGFGWGWNNWGWNRWYRPWRWNVGFGWGWNNWGWYDPFWCPPFYSAWGWGGFGNPYWNNGFYGRTFAYNAGRRGSYLNAGRSTLSRRSSLVNSRNYNTTRSNTRSNSIRRNNSSYYNPRTRNNSTYSNSRSRNSSSISAPRSNSRSRNSSSISRPSSRNSSSSRISSPSRSSSSGSRSSGRSGGGRRR